MPSTARQPRDEVGVDGADHDVTVAYAVPDPIVLREPGELGPGEVGVETQAGQLGDARLVAGLAQPVTDVGGAPVLPDDRAAGGGKGLAVPQHRRLALVRDADGRRWLDIGDGERLPARRQRCLPDLLRLVLDPARLREVLGELLVA